MLFNGMALVSGMVGDLFLVLDHLPVKLVGHQIDRSIHIPIGAIGVNVLALEVHGDFGLVQRLLDRQDHVRAGDIVEVPDDAIQLLLGIVADGGSDVDVVTGDVQVHGASWSYRVLRRLTGGMLRDSRYLATVRLATTMPCSPRISAIRASESALWPSSALTSCLMSARIAVEEAAPPLSVATWLPKKYFSS